MPSEWTYHVMMKRLHWAAAGYQHCIQTELMDPFELPIPVETNPVSPERSVKRIKNKKIVPDYSMFE